MKEKCFMVGSQDNFIEEEQPLCGMLFSKNKIKITAHPFLSHASSPMKHSFLMTDISSPVVFSTWVFNIPERLNSILNLHVAENHSVLEKQT